MVTIFHSAQEENAVFCNSIEDEILKEQKEKIESGLLISIKGITEKKTNRKVLVVEPHSDDGTYSAGGLLSKLVLNGDKIVSVCVFSKHNTLELIRKNEGRRIYLDIMKGNIIFLDLLDGIFRTGNDKKSSFSKDFLCVRKMLAETIRNEKPNLILGPAGIGGHVDHVLVNMALMDIFRTNKKQSIWLYEDYPYCVDRIEFINSIRTMLKNGKVRPEYIDVSNHIFNKTSYNMVYQSQHKNKWSKLYEIYNDLAKTVGFEAKVCNKNSEKIYERFWVLQD